MTERRLKQTGRNVDNWHDAVVGHTSRSNDAKDTDRVIIDMVWRGNNTAAIENPIARFLTDEYLYPVRIDAAIQEVENQPFARKCVKQTALGINIGKFGEIHQLGFARHDIHVIRVGCAIHRRLSDSDDVMHRLVH